MAKVFRFRLEDRSLGEFREVRAGADSEDEAVAAVEAQEQKKVSFVLSPEEAVGLEKRLKEGTLSGRDRARLFAHQQEKPYVIVKAKGD